MECHLATRQESVDTTIANQEGDSSGEWVQTTVCSDGSSLLQVNDSAGDSSGKALGH